MLQNTAVKDAKLPLGRETDYPQNYAPEALCPVPRAASREPLGITEPLPFSGEDTWNAWDLTWLGRGGLPRVATAEFRVPADSPNIVESKSLKLYLGSFAMSTFADDAAVREAIERDLGTCTGSRVGVRLNPDPAIAALGGDCIDALDVACPSFEVDPGLLSSDAAALVEERLHTHLLRSLCPVTGQPDIGSLEIAYAGPRIDRASLLRYVVSFRRHQDFHEACVERMFVDLLERCGATRLSVHALYQRRGGIDINPFRSNFEAAPRRLRLWRQ